MISCEIPSKARETSRITEAIAVPSLRVQITNDRSGAQSMVEELSVWVSVDKEKPLTPIWGLDEISERFAIVKKPNPDKVIGAHNWLWISPWYL
jgi:hypothetical protein